MSSRDVILREVGLSQRSSPALPFLPGRVSQEPVADEFVQRLTAIGGQVIAVSSVAEIPQKLPPALRGLKRVVHNLSELPAGEYLPPQSISGHDLQTVDLAILQGDFGVAENGAIWLTDRALPHRALPFICQHLALVITRSALVASMHEAYAQLDTVTYAYGVFIAGPSKTADIEQSLVVGAHGARSLTVFLLPDHP